MSEEIKNIQEELNEQMQIRRDKLAEYEADGIYPVSYTHLTLPTIA